MITTVSGIQIESFAQDELTTDEPSTNHRELAVKLGLNGQLKRMESTTTNPFPVCETSIFRLISSLCPVSTELSKYDADLIPFRVLELIELAQNSGLTVFKVFHPEVVKDDPFVLGYENDRYDARPYLIARWGKHLASWGGMHNQVCTELHKQAVSAIAELESVAKQLKAGNMIQIPSWATRPRISISYH
jgi:hypothetical protein